MLSLILVTKKIKELSNPFIFFVTNIKDNIDFYLIQSVNQKPVTVFYLKIKSLPPTYIGFILSNPNT